MPSKLTAKQAEQKIAQLSKDLSPRQRQHLSMLASGLHPRSLSLPLTSAFKLLFGKQKVIEGDLSFGTTSIHNANKTMTRLVDAVREAAGEVGMDFALQIMGHRSAGAEGRSLHFEGELPAIVHETIELDRVQEAGLVKDPRGLPLNDEPRITLAAAIEGKPLVRWFASYAPEDRKLAEMLKKELILQLRVSKEYCFEFSDLGQLLPGEAVEGRLAQHLADTHLGVLFLSHEYLANANLTGGDLLAFVLGSGKGLPGKRLVPVAMSALDLQSTDLKGLERLQIFIDDEDKAFEQRTREYRKAWVAQLSQRLHQLLKRYAAVTAPLAVGDNQSDEYRVGARFGYGCSTPDLESLSCPVPNLARQASLDAKRLEAPQILDAGEGVDVLQYLMQWVSESDSPRLFALLGEYGMGKTITCQRFVRELEQQRRDNPQLPAPLYFDFRRLTGLGTRTCTPTLPEILDECMQRGWQFTGGPLPEASDLIEQARLVPLQFVFDGLDEALVHLTAVDGQAFTRELLRLVPRSGGSELCQTRVLISCRTHYFRTLSDQQNHFTGQDRDGANASQFRALQLLPFNDAQISSYFRHVLSRLDVNSTMDLIRNVHNLADLSRRPYTLRLVGEFIPELEATRASGNAVFGITLYRKLVEQWLQRDEGKHHLQKEHKLRLMSHLAARIWKLRQRLLPVGELEAWFHEWLEQDDRLRRRYRDISLDQLEEDLRTATFLVREDDPKSGGFRFAHSSMQEYFLATYLFEAVRENRRQDWQLPLVSDETLNFFAEHLLEAQDESLLGTLAGWRGPYLPRASEQWLYYALKAECLQGAQRWPRVSLAGADLSGAKLSRWKFQGRSNREPLNLSAANFSGACLRESHWQHVLLHQGHFTQADLTRAEILNSKANGADFRNAQCGGATFRHCELSSSNWAGASVRRASFLFTEPPELPLFLVAPTTPLTTLPSHATKRLHIDSGHSDSVTSSGFSPGGLRIISGGYDGKVKLWDTQSGQCLLTLDAHSDGVSNCGFSQDGRHLVSGGYDGKVKLWDAESGQCLLTLDAHSRPVNCCGFSPGGLHIISGGCDGKVKLWDAQSGQCLLTLDAHSDGVSSCSYSQDGRHIVSGGDDGKAKLWDAQNGQCLLTLDAHSRQVSSCAFSPDRRRLVSGGYDGKVKLWDAESGRCLLTLDTHSSRVISCGFSPDGRRLVSGGYDGKVLVWDAQTGALLCQLLMLSQGEHAVLNPEGTDIIEATAAAWRWLRYQLFDDAGRLVDVVPVEAFGALPAPSRMVVRP